MPIPTTDPPANAIHWLSTPDTTTLRDLWLGRLRATQPVTLPAHASAETALLFMRGRAAVTHASPLGTPSARHAGEGDNAAPYGWPRGDLLILPPSWTVTIEPLTDGVEILVFQAWLPEGVRIGLPVRCYNATTERHSATCLSRAYPAGRRLHIGTVENADGYGSYPLMAQDWQGEMLRYFLIEPDGGEAIQRLRGRYVTGAEIDTAVVVKSGDVCALPCGNTTVLRPPNSAAFYVWAWIETEDKP